MAKFDVGQATEKFRGAFNGFTRGQKTMLGLAGLAVVFGAFMLSKWTGQTQYSTLYSNLAASRRIGGHPEPRCTRSEVSAHQRWLVDPGSLRTSCTARVSTCRPKASRATVHRVTRLLDKQGITTSEFRQHVDYQRALEGELSKTIRAIDGIDATSVHLVIPQEDLFSGDTTKPSASVLVRTSGTATTVRRPGRRHRSPGCLLG